MKFLENFKTSVGKKKLDKESKQVKRKKALTNFTNTKSFAIVFNCIDENTYMLTRKFARELKDLGKSIKVFAFIDDKKTPEYWLPKENYDFITRKDINLYNIPKGDSFEKFIHQEFDVLISLQIEPCFPIDYVVKMSRAKLKVGYSEDNAAIYDFMINTKNKSNLKEYIEQVMHYLNLINSQTHE